MKNLRLLARLFRYVLPYRGKLLGLISIALVGVGFEVLKPLPLKVVIDSVLGNKPLPPLAQHVLGAVVAVPDKQSTLAFCLVLIFISTVGAVAITFVVTNFTARLCQRLVNDLSIDLYAKLQQLSLSFHAKNQVGDLLQRMSSDTFVVYFLVAQIIVPAITSIICLAGMFYVMASISLSLALVALAVVPFLAISLAAFSKPMERTTDLQYERFGDFSAFVQQSLVSMRIIQAFAREPYMRQKMEVHALEYNKAFQTATKISAGYNQISSLLTGLAAVVLVGMGARQGINGTLSAGDLYVFLGYIAALFGPVNALSTAVGTAIVIGTRSKRLFSILDSDETVVESPHPKAPAQLQGTVELQDVVFGYTKPDHGKPTLRRINLRVEAGQIVAIVGPTGAGKTSLISLLSRFYDPWSGRILFDGYDVRDLPLHWLRENMALVLQDPFLFPMTVAENIGFGNPDATLAEIEQAARAAQAHEFIAKLPQGYETVLVEAGLSLSGGEKQRISLARAFLKQAPILVLDEPTSALDALTEAKVFEELARLTHGRTVFIITHRLSAIKHADLIITLKDGEVVESGTHHSLLREGNTYADMFNHQQIA
jgi:ABC-type multidrug transport system fused ATPase/permease subunit